jgi:hypothetical protein
MSHCCFSKARYLPGDGDLSTPASDNIDVKSARGHLDP